MDLQSVCACVKTPVPFVCRALYLCQSDRGFLAVALAAVLWHAIALTWTNIQITERVGNRHLLDEEWNLVFIFSQRHRWTWIEPVVCLPNQPSHCTSVQTLKGKKSRVVTVFLAALRSPLNLNHSPADSIFSFSILLVCWLLTFLKSLLFQLQTIHLGCTLLWKHIFLSKWKPS